MPTTVNLVTNKSDRPLTDQQTKQETNTVSKTLTELGRIIKNNYTDQEILDCYGVDPNDLEEIGRQARFFNDINADGELN